MRKDLEKKIKNYFATRTLEKNGVVKDIIARPFAGPDHINVGDNDYLCIANNKNIIDAQIECLKAQNGEIVMSSLYLSDSVYCQTEKEMASFYGFESAILTQSGYVSNTGVMHGIGGPKVNLYVDQNMHVSIWDGIFFSHSKAHRFKHNNLVHLEEKIKKNGSGIIIVESLYSLNGDYVPLKELIKIKQKYDCILVLDESHTLGTCGEQGKGYAHMLGLTKHVDIITASLAKSFCCRAGIILGSAPLITFLKEHSNNYIFSSCLMNNDIFKIRATFEVIKNMDKEREKLQKISTYFFDTVKKMGYTLYSKTPSHIVSILFNGEQNMIRMNKYLISKGIISSVFIYPATPLNTPLLRFSFNIGLTQEKMDLLIKELAIYKSQNASHL